MNIELQGGIFGVFWFGLVFGFWFLVFGFWFLVFVFVILILNYIYEILVAGPALYVYLTSVGMDAVQILMFVIVFLTLPLFVLALSCVFGWLMANIMRHVRRKNIVTLVLSLGFFGIYLYAVSSIQEYKVSFI